MKPSLRLCGCIERLMAGVPCMVHACVRDHEVL
jgi:hypothetical protein